MNDNTNIYNGSNKSSKLATIFYIVFFLCLAGFGFYFYQDNYDFYLPKKDVKMLCGSEYTIFLLGKKGYNDMSYYNYSSSDDNVVSVDNFGNLIAKSAGTAKITVKSKHGFHTNTIDVKVSGDNVYHISFENDDINTYLNEEYKIIPLINEESNFDVSLEWSSSDEKIVSVDQNGNTMSKNVGSAYITAKIKDTDFSSSVLINVSKKETKNEKSNTKPSKVEKLDEYVDTEPVKIPEIKEENKPKQPKNENVSVTGISGFIPKTTLMVGEKVKLNWTITPSNATNKKVDFSSNNEEVAKVDSSGNITATGVGSCDIIFSSIDGNKSSYVSINVVNKKVEASDIKLNKNKLNLYVGDTSHLSYKLTPNNATTDVTWSSSNNSALKVDSSGNITALGVGSANVIVKTSNGKTDNCEINITKKTIKLNSIKLNKTSTTIIEGGSETLNVIFEPSNATNKDVTWSSSNENVAVVDKNGKITAKNEGNTTITASSNGLNSTCKVNVSKKVVSISSIKLNKSSLTLDINDKYSFSYTISPSNATNQNVTWESSNSSVVKVDSKGNITALKSGNATITVKSVDSNKTDSCYVKVNEQKNVSGVELSKRNLGMYLNDTFNLTANILPNNASNKNVVWESSDSSIVSVSDGKLTANKVGSATITVKTIEGNYIDTCNVYVTKDSKSKVKATKIAFDISSKQLYKGDKVILNVSFSPAKTTIRELTWESDNPSVAKVDSEGRVIAVGLGNATISATTTDGSAKTAKFKVSVVVKGNYIDIREKTYKNYYEGIKTTISSNNKSIHMQNFVIDNFGKSNENVYLSTVYKSNSGYYYNQGLSSGDKANITRTLIFKLDRSTIDNINRPTMYIENAGHGQAIDIDSDGSLWINAYGNVYSVVYEGEGGNWWGGHSGLMNIRFKENNPKEEVQTIIDFKIVDSNNKAYKLPTPAIDEKNDLIAITTGDNIIVPKSTKILIYKYSDFKKGKLTLLYSFVRASKLKSYRQGTGLKGGYYYELRGNPGQSSHIEAYDMLGNQIYSQKMGNGYTTANEREAEGIHFYNGKMYIGTTHKNNGNYYFDINYYE